MYLDNNYFKKSFDQNREFFDASFQQSASQHNEQVELARKLHQEGLQVDEEHHQESLQQAERYHCESMQFDRKSHADPCGSRNWCSWWTRSRPSAISSSARCRTRSTTRRNCRWVNGLKHAKTCVMSSCSVWPSMTPSWSAPLCSWAARSSISPRAPPPCPTAFPTSTTLSTACTSDCLCSSCSSAFRPAWSCTDASTNSKSTKASGTGSNATTTSFAGTKACRASSYSSSAWFLYSWAATHFHTCVSRNGTMKTTTPCRSRPKPKCFSWASTWPSLSSCSWSFPS